MDLLARRTSAPLLFLSSRPAEASFSLLVDWIETSTAHIFKADIPGLSKKDVDVQIHEGSILEISGEFKQLQEEGKGEIEWHLVERPQGRFLRRFQLPDEIRVEDIKAKVGDGLLTIYIPKKQPPIKPVSRKVPIVTSRL